MKKFSLILMMVLLSTLLLVGCDPASDPECDFKCDKECCNETQNGTDNEPEQTPEVIPTFAELVEINDLENVLKTNTNVFATYSEVSINEVPWDGGSVIYFDTDPLDNKVDFHSVTYYKEGKKTYNSRIGDVYYSVGDENYVMSALEVDSDIFKDESIDFSKSVPVGKGYIENGQIVYHCFEIREEYKDYYTAERYDCTVYFNKDTKLMEKAEVTGYNNNHEAYFTYVIEVYYSVEDKGGETTAYEIVNESGNLADLEIIVNYNTPEQKIYNLKAYIGSDLWVCIGGDVYCTYTDPEYKNEIYVLEGCTAGEKVTIYASTECSEDDIRYTVTEEEWAVFNELSNYTVELDYDGESYIHKYTDSAIELSGHLILFIDGRQYELREGASGLVAYDITYVDYWKGSILDEEFYEDFFFDEQALCYVNTDYEEIGYRAEIRFENGVPVSYLIFDLEDENALISQLKYTNVGETVINIPDYTFYYDAEPDPKKVVTEAQWNLYVNEKNFTGTMYTVIDGEIISLDVISTEDALEVDGKIIVTVDGVKYILEEIEGTLYAVEYEGLAVPEVLLPEGLNFEDFEYDKLYECYAQKDTEGLEWTCRVSFYEGVIAAIEIKYAGDPETDEDDIVYAFMVEDIGNAEIEVPDYVMAE